jgi:hypothetical protein
MTYEPTPEEIEAVFDALVSIFDPERTKKVTGGHLTRAAIIRGLRAAAKVRGEGWRPIATLEHPNVDNERVIKEGKQVIQIAESDPCLLSDGKKVWSGRDMVELKSGKQIPWAMPLAAHWMPLPSAPEE